MAETSLGALIAGGKLGALVRARRNEIVDGWVAAAERATGERRLRAELTGSGAALLDALVAALARDAVDANGEAGEPTDAKRSGGGVPGLGRGESADLPLLARELDLLRDVVLDLARETGVSPTLDDYRTFSAALSSVLASGIRGFVASREDELRRLQERYLDLADHAPAAVFLKDREGRYLFVNRRFGRLLGRRRRELVGRTNEELLAPDAAATLRASDLRAAAGEVVEAEVAFHGAQGERHFIVLEYPAAVGVDGSEVIAGIGLDVTERRAAEDEARRALELLELGDAFLELDREWRVVRVNRNLERIASRGRSEVLGRVIWDVWPEIASPESRYWREYHHVMERREPRDFEEYFPPLDIWSAVTAYPTRGGGVAVFLRDVTTRRRTEREKREALALLEGIFAAAPVGLSFVDRDLRYVRANEALATISGTRPAQMVGRTIREVLPLLADQVEPNYRRVFETGEAILEVEVVGESPRGRGTWLASYYPIADPGGKVALVGTVVQDITARKAAEHTVAEARELEHQLVGIASHDLRNPLNAIVIGTRALAARSWPEKERRILERVRAAAERATRMTRDLLDVTRARLGGGIAIAPRETDLHAIVEQTVDELRAAHPGRVLRVLHGGWTGGTWDPDRLAQVIGNLVSNALRYGAADVPVTVTVAGQADLVRLDVHNGGDPIAPERIPGLFHAWARGAAPAGEAGVESTGLGLYIVDRIVDAHGGRVEVRSSAEEGTTFTVILPRDARRAT